MFAVWKFVSVSLEIWTAVTADVELALFAFVVSAIFIALSLPMYLATFHLPFKRHYSQHSQSHQRPDTNLLSNTQALRPQHLPHKNHRGNVHSSREGLRTQAHNVLDADVPARPLPAPPARRDRLAPQPVGDGRAGKDHVDKHDHGVQGGADQARGLQAEQRARERGLAPRRRRQGQAAGDVVQEQDRRRARGRVRGLAAACAQG